MGIVAPGRGEQSAKVGILGTALLALLAGCATAQGGSGTTGWEVGRQWGCDPARVEREYSEARASGADPSTFIPREGWSACQLLSLLGPPAEVSLAESEAGDTYHLFYRSDGESHVVMLRQGLARSWRVSAVAW